MMKIRLVGMVAVVVLMVGAMALPAAAATAGVFQGQAAVAQGAGECGAGNGAGLGLPTVNQFKNGSFKLSSSLVVDVANGLLDVDICGKLTSVAGVGAACGMSKGYDGDGRIGTTQIRDAGWKVSAGGTLTVIGEATGKVTGTLVSLVQAQGAAPCLSKAATNFTVAGAYVIVPGPQLTWNDVTDNVDPKDGGGIWGPKK